MKYINEDLRNDIRKGLERAAPAARDKEIEAAVDAMEEFFEQWWQMRAVATFI